MDLTFKTKWKLFRLDELSDDEKFRHLYALTILLVFYSAFTSLWIISLMADAPVLFVMAILTLAAGFALFFAIKNFNRVEDEKPKTFENL